MRVRMMLGGMAVIGLLLAGCGGSEDADAGDGSTTTEEGGTDSTEPLDGDVAELAAGLKEGFNGAGFSITDEEAACWARRVSEDIGIETVKEIGSDPNAGIEALSTGDQEKLIQGLQGCTDLAAMMAPLIAQSGGVDEAVGTCVVTAIDDAGLLDDLIVAGMQGAAAPPADVAEAIQSASAACLTPTT